MRDSICVTTASAARAVARASVSAEKSIWIMRFPRLAQGPFDPTDQTKAQGKFGFGQTKGCDSGFRIDYCEVMTPFYKLSSDQKRDLAQLALSGLIRNKRLHVHRQLLN
jgi:hypothetical protein